MTPLIRPEPYPLLVRIGLGLLAFLLIIFAFQVMLALSQPSEFLNAYSIIQKGPRRAIDIQKLGMLNFKQLLYLSGPLISASNEKSTAPLFNLDKDPLIAPTLYTDESGAVEIVCRQQPLSPKALGAYAYNQPLHILGWRRAEATLWLFAVAATQEELLQLMDKRSNHWRKTLFIQGLVLAFLVFVIFWLLNLILLATPALRLFQLLIVNVVCLILFYSVFLMASYPFAHTLLPTLAILGLANVVFVPLAMLINRKYKI
ncbi:hypothetical protein JW933_05990 [candidate division FCPU426 bacterium]|nr:hypothetical protein [candidate division FCPU426 bacterium]